MSAILTIEELARIDPSVSVFVDVQVSAFLIFAAISFLVPTFSNTCAEHLGRHSFEKVGQPCSTREVVP